MAKVRLIGVRSLIVLICSLLMKAMISSIHAEKHQLDDDHDGRISSLKLYSHFFLEGEKQSWYEVANSSTVSGGAASFGKVWVVDDKVTVGKAFDSLEVGRLQGVITSVDMRKRTLALNLNFYFTDDYKEMKGSTLSILGRDRGIFAEQEYPVVGGTGRFRDANGYALSKTTEFIDVSSGRVLDGVVEYTFELSYYEFGNSVFMPHAYM